MNFRLLKNAAICVLGMTILNGCSVTSVFQSKSAAVESGPQLKTVKTAKVIKQKIVESPELTADVFASVSRDVVTKTGGTVVQFMKKRGDYMQEGEVIVKINSVDLQAQRDKALLNIRSIQSSLETAKVKTAKDFETSKVELDRTIKKMEQDLTDLTKKYNKMKNDYDVGLASKAQLEQAELQHNNFMEDFDRFKEKQQAQDAGNPLAELQGQLKNAQDTLKEVDQALGSLDVKAPISGMLTDLLVEAGVTLPPGSKVGFIQKIDPVKIQAQLNEEAVKLVRGKQELTYYVSGSTNKMTGPISFLSELIDTRSRTYELDLDVPNPELNLKPGMKVRIQLTNEQDGIAVTVPTYSMLKEGGNAYVFVLVDDHVEKRKIELGRLNEPNQEVLSGVDEGEIVVISGQSQLKDKEIVLVANSENK